MNISRVFPHKIKQAEFDHLLNSIAVLWRYSVLTDSQHDKAVERLEKMYKAKETVK